MSNDNHLVAHECGNGWGALIEPVVSLANECGATITQIKEKFGRLRVYFDADNANDPSVARLEDRVAQAEVLAAATCEMCGKPGVLMTSGTWLKTLCADDAFQLGYKKRA